MEVSPDIGVPFPEKDDMPDLTIARARDFFGSGANTPAKPAPSIFIGYQPEQTTFKAPARKPLGDAVSIKALLEECTYQEFKDSGELHKYVMGRWVDMSAPGAEYPHNIQLKALENLAKAGGMMIERSEVTIKDRPTSELEDKLRAKLAKFMGSVDISDVQAQFREIAPPSNTPARAFTSLIDDVRDE
jgi:hypothetical protein